MNSVPNTFIIQEHPIVSIILPTKNRARYALPTIRGILAWESSQFELVVQDNSSNNELEDAVLSIQDTRLRYQHTTHSIDMAENFTLGTLRTRGVFLAFIGDDDGVIEDVVAAAKWGVANNYDAVLPTTIARYLWPDIQSPMYGKRFSGTLRIDRFSGRSSFPSGLKEVSKCMKSAGQNFYHLPRIYFGLVRRECLNRVRDRCGYFFPGPSPDLAGAIAIGCIANRIAAVDFPLFIAGTGAGSTGGLGVVKRHVGRLEDWPHLPKWAIKEWSKIVPRLFLGQTIWAEDVVQAVRATGQDRLMVDFNIPLLHASCLCFHPAYRQEIIKSFIGQLPKSQLLRGKWWLRLFIGYLGCWLRRMASLVRNASALLSIGRETVILHINDSEGAMSALASTLRASNKSFAQSIDS